MSSDLDKTSGKPEQFLLERLPAALILEIRIALAQAQICLPKPAYDVDYLWAQEVLDFIREKGCHTLDDALFTVKAAVRYYFSEKCTASVVGRAGMDFNEIEEADRILSKPDYFTDFSRYDGDPELKIMQQYLLADRLFVATYLLSEHDRPFGPRAKKLLRAMPRVLDWLDVNLLAVTEVEKKGKAEEPFCTSVRKCTRAINDAVRKTLPRLEIPRT